MMTTQTISDQTRPGKQTGKGFRLWWTLAGFGGFIGGMTIKTLIDILAEIGGFTYVLAAIPPTLFGTLLGIMLGLCTGVAQWLVLRRTQRRLGGWVGATLAAWTIFWTLHNAEAFGFAHTPWGLVGQGFGHGAIIGGMAGFAQWLVLRGHLPGAGRWLWISIVSWSVAGGIMHWLLDVLLAAQNIHGPFDVMIASTLAALFSSFGMKGLLDQAPGNEAEHNPRSRPVLRAN